MSRIKKSLVCSLLVLIVLIQTGCVYLTQPQFIPYKLEHSSSQKKDLVSLDVLSARVYSVDGIRIWADHIVYFLPGDHEIGYIVDGWVEEIEDIKISKQKRDKLCANPSTAVMSFEACSEFGIRLPGTTYYKRKRKKVPGLVEETCILTFEAGRIYHRNEVNEMIENYDKSKNPEGCVPNKH